MGSSKCLVLFSILLYGVSGDPFNYHEKVGIKLVEDIRVAESKSLERTVRIIGGTEVSQDSHISYQAGIIIILTTGWTSVCGGSLVSNSRVLTAAHCWSDGRNQARQFTIVLGSSSLFTGGTRLVTTSVVTHPSWNPQDMTFDIAMVTIPRVEYTNSIQRVALPTLADINEDFVGASGLVSGYGKISDAQSAFPITTSLHQTTVTIISNSECQESYDLLIHAGHLCSGSSGVAGTCDGDSGGPLTVVVNNSRTLVGVVSFGLGESCETPLPSAYTRVTAFVGWIEANL